MVVLEGREDELDKEPETTWQATQQLYPGTRLRNPSTPTADPPTSLPETFPRQLAIDGGTECEGKWRQSVEERGGIIIASLPRESQTNSNIERWNGETERKRAVSLLTAGANARFWFWAARVFYFNYARTHVDESGLNPFCELWGRNDTRD